MKIVYAVLLVVISMGNVVAQAWFNLGYGVRPLDSTYTGNVVNALAVDSLNNLLYVGGYFYYTGDTVSPNLAAWDGKNWLPVSTGTSNVQVNALTMYHDTLFVAGKGGVSRYFNHQSFGTGHFGGAVNCFALYHDMLYAGGDVGIKKYTGSKWVNIDSIMPDLVLSMGVYNDQLIVGGKFKYIGDSSFWNIAGWKDGHWNHLGTGTSQSGSTYLGYVYALNFFQNNLIAGGAFDSAGDVSALNVASWDGQTWSSMPGLCPDQVTGLYSDKVNGLYAAGWFIQLYGTECVANRVAHWNGNSWLDLGFGLSNTADCVTFYDDNLIVGGQFRTAGVGSVNNIAGYGNGFVTSSDALFKSKFRLFPNPTINELSISFPFSNNIIIIYDLYGREVMHFNIKNTNATQLNISSLDQGVYVVSIRDEKGVLIAEKELFKE